MSKHPFPNFPNESNKYVAARKEQMPSDLFRYFGLRSNAGRKLYSARSYQRSHASQGIPIRSLACLTRSSGHP
jgi:hypothetical protein